MEIQKAEIILKNMQESIDSYDLGSIDSLSYDRFMTIVNLCTSLALYVQEANKKVSYMYTELNGINKQLKAINIARNRNLLSENLMKAEPELLKRKEDLELAINFEKNTTTIELPEGLLSKINSWWS